MPRKITWKTFKSKLAIVKIRLKADAATDMVLGGMLSPVNKNHENFAQI